MKFFNTAGPSNSEDHYCLDPLRRVNLPELETLFAQKKYFVLHAPRQTGKTTCLLALADYLNARDEYRCLYVNFEVGQAARGDIAGSMRAILSEIGSRAARVLGDETPGRIWPGILEKSGPLIALNETLSSWAESSNRPLVILIDEIDSLVGDTLISVLRQLRAGYDKRPSAFPQSVVLCGLRDVRDYRMHQGDGSPITGGSPFNIKAKSLRLGSFTHDELAGLYAQHTAETGQVFQPEAVELAFELTYGQPWLVNALAYEACFEQPAGRDRSQPVTAEMILAAKDALIMRRETHIDQLADKLKEDRVRRTVAAMLADGDLPDDVLDDDIEYVIDLGLARRTSSGLQISNPIYREVVPRQLTSIIQMNFEARQRQVWYIGPDGRIDMPKLLTAFQEFFREHSEHWLERFAYREAGPQLLLQAFLQRIVNGGGRIEREYGLGRMRTDLLVIWPNAASGGADSQRVVIELKVLYKSLEKTIADGLAQTWEYMDRCGTVDGNLVIFDRTAGKSWDEKVFRREESFNGRAIMVWGM